MYLVVAQMNNIPDPRNIKPPLLIELPVIGNITKDVDAVRVMQEKWRWCQVWQMLLKIPNRRQR